jgi:hypothetical protein
MESGTPSESTNGCRGSVGISGVLCLNQSQRLIFEGASPVSGKCGEGRVTGAIARLTSVIPGFDSSKLPLATIFGSRLRRSPLHCLRYFLPSK